MPNGLIYLPYVKRNLVEAEMSEPLTAWLWEDGWEVVTEVPVFHRAVDLCAYRGSEVRVFELKGNLSPVLLRQCLDSRILTHFVWAVVRSLPKPESRIPFERSGIGIIHMRTVEDMLVPVELCPPHLARPVDPERATLFLKRLEHMPKGGLAGVPNLAGPSMQKDTRLRVLEYLRAHPLASWEEIHANVPSHHATPERMKAGMEWYLRRHWSRPQSTSSRS